MDNRVATDFSAAELAKFLDGKVIGSSEAVVNSIASLDCASPNQLSHLSSRQYQKSLTATNAGVVILHERDVQLLPVSSVGIVVSNPYLAYARVTALFDRRHKHSVAGIHESALIHESASVHESSFIGFCVEVGAETIIDAGAVIGSGAVIGKGCQIGSDVRIDAGVVIYDDVTIGARSHISSGAVIGADGFGYTADENHHLVKIHQLGGVTIGADVSIGAMTAVDRGALEDTVIEDGVKIDNLVQVGHNCRIRAHSIICGSSAVAGSTTLGRHCVLAGACSIGGSTPISICDGVTLTGGTVLTHSIDKPGVYSGYIRCLPQREWQKNNARFMKLDYWISEIRKTLKSSSN